MRELIISFLQILLNSKIYILIISKFKGLDKLEKYNKSASPAFKKKLFVKHSLENGVWIETGTYLGDSTEYLSNNAQFVYSIEPSKKYYDIAKEKLSHKKNIELINGTSEESLENILKDLISDNVSFWLDGHFSGGDTFEGTNHSPVLIELDIIKKHLSKYKNIVILIDDFRIFSKNYPKANKVNYPNQKELIRWAKTNRLNWYVKKNIFIMKKFNNPS